VIARSHDAILLDLDGTLVDDTGHVGPRTKNALHALSASGVHVMIATGRSELGTGIVVRELGLFEPAVVYNGAALWCPKSDRMLEERLLSGRTVRRALDFAARRELLAVVQLARIKYSIAPRDAIEREALAFMEGMHTVESGELPAENLIRITLFSREHAQSGDFASEVEAAVDQPLYMTHFPLSALPQHRSSPLHVVDIQPPCLGKGEALRILRETWSIPAERVVAVGDATNDLPMIEAAGLGVAMKRSMPEVLAAADLVIGDNNEEAIADLVQRLFGVGG
jgi:hypothetical protein